MPVVGCGNPAHDSSAAHAAIGGDIVARVGDVDLPASLVGAVAARRRIARSEALGLLIDDAVVANVARAQRVDERSGVRLTVTSTRARATVDRIKAKARMVPPSDDEVREASAERWLEVDVPETMVVVYAVALRPKPANAQAEQAAKQVAAAVAAAEVGAVDAADFKARAEAVPQPGVELVVETLDPFTADGRFAVGDGSGRLDRRFAAAAAALTSPGATSGVVESDFGWHVIRLIERRPGRVVAMEERRRMFAEDIYARRAQDALDAVKAGLRSREGVTMANGLDELLALALPATQTQASAAPAPDEP